MPGAGHGSTSRSEIVTSRREPLGILTWSEAMSCVYAVLFEDTQYSYKDTEQRKLTKCYYLSLSQQAASEIQATHRMWQVQIRSEQVVR